MSASDLEVPATADEPQEDYEAMREDIERTRAEMGETIDSIQDRLSPEHIKEQLMERVHEQYEEAKEAVRDATVGRLQNMAQAAGDTAYTAGQRVVSTIRNNPIPAALVGIGIWWLAVNTMNESTDVRLRRMHRNRTVGNGDETRSYASGSIPYSNQRDEPGLLEKGQRAASDMMDRAKSTASDFANNVQDTATEWAGTVQDQAVWLGNQIQGTMHENPLAIGAAVLAVGAAVGYAIPQTQKEGELMGEARDNLIDEVEDLTRGALQQVRDTADRIAERAQTPQEPQQQAPPPRP
jgi:hypothetical protein